MCLGSKTNFSLSDDAGTNLRVTRTDLSANIHHLRSTRAGRSSSSKSSSSSSTIAARSSRSAAPSRADPASTSRWSVSGRRPEAGAARRATAAGRRSSKSTLRRRRRWRRARRRFIARPSRDRWRSSAPWSLETRKSRTTSNKKNFRHRILFAVKKNFFPPFFSNFPASDQFYFYPLQATHDSLLTTLIQNNRLR